MKKLFLLLGSFCLILTLFSHPALAASNDSQTEMRNFVRTTLAQNHMRGSVVVVKDGIPEQISYGWAWYGKRYGNGNSKVVYPTASLQKVITGAIIVQLINQYDGTSQQFSQYTKISRWYPNLKNADKITVGNLLTHTSGITASQTEVNRGYVYSEQGAIDWLVNHINNASSGMIGSYYYNNANFILLAGIISKLTGNSYAENVQTRIIQPLGLTHTYLYQNIPSTMTDAISYVYLGKNYQKPSYMKASLASQIPGAGDLFSTPMDYYKILLALTDGTILSKSDFYYLTHLKSKIRNYSGGLYLEKNDQLKLAYGSFSTYHFANWFQMTSDNQNGLIMFLNQSGDNEPKVKVVGYQILNHIKANTFSAN